jgi:hypothetical protein
MAEPLSPVRVLAGPWRRQGLACLACLACLGAEASRSHEEDTHPRHCGERLEVVDHLSVLEQREQHDIVPGTRRSTSHR